MAQNFPAQWRVKTKERNMLLCFKHAHYYMENGYDVEKLPDDADVRCEECSADFANN